MRAELHALSPAAFSTTTRQLDTPVGVYLDFCLLFIPWSALHTCSTAVLWSPHHSPGGATKRSVSPDLPLHQHWKPTAACTFRHCLRASQHKPSKPPTRHKLKSLPALDHRAIGPTPLGRLLVNFHRPSSPDCFISTCARATPSLARYLLALRSTSHSYHYLAAACIHPPCPPPWRPSGLSTSA